MLIEVSNFNEAKKLAEWGTYGRDGKDPLKFVRLIDCENSHLEAIYMAQPCGTDYKKLIESILRDRKEAQKIEEEAKRKIVMYHDMGFELGVEVRDKRTGMVHTVEGINYEKGTLDVSGGFSRNLPMEDCEIVNPLRDGDKYYHKGYQEKIYTLKNIPGTDLWALIRESNPNGEAGVRGRADMLSSLKKNFTKIQ